MEATHLPRAKAGRAGGAETLVYAGLVLAMLLVVATAVAGFHPAIALAAVTAALVLAAAHRFLFAWTTLLGAVVFLMLFIPVKRYTLAGIGLEPLRVMTALVVLALVSSALVQPEVRARSGMGLPIAAIGGAIVLSEFTNYGRITGGGLRSDVLLSVLGFVAYFAAFWLVCVALRSRSHIDNLLMAVVIGAAAIGVSAVIESRTRYNPFDHLQQYIPILHFSGVPYVPDRGGGARAYASGQHPIAFGAALVMLIPIAVYLYRRSGRHLWWLAIAGLALGALATRSRTGIVMLVIELIVYLILKRRETVRLLPYLIPVVLAAHVAVPGTLGSITDAFSPNGGIVKSEQNAGAEWHSNYGVGRIGEWTPALKEWERTPIFGQGFGTRVTDLKSPTFNAPILDDQWLGVLLELGVVGVAALIWFFRRIIVRMSRMSHRVGEDDSWLAVGLAASIAAYAFGMFTFDAFAFVQVTLLMFILVGAACAFERPGMAERLP
ncbi:MAG: O-antigen ligase family protein [Solirubrobacteraceae bacterium]